MCHVSLLQLSEDPSNQAHAHPLRLVRGWRWQQHASGKGGGSGWDEALISSRIAWALAAGFNREGCPYLLKNTNLPFIYEWYGIVYFFSFPSLSKMYSEVHRTAVVVLVSLVVNTTLQWCRNKFLPSVCCNTSVQISEAGRGLNSWEAPLWCLLSHRIEELRGNPQFLLSITKRFKAVPASGNEQTQEFFFTNDDSVLWHYGAELAIFTSIYFPSLIAKLWC